MSGLKAGESAARHIPEPVAWRAAMNVTPSGGCEISTYSTNSAGYAQIGWSLGDRSAMTTAHRAAWVHHHGPIPEGMTVDHTCKNRQCVRVDHLRLLSNFENARRTNGRDWPLGQCANGHPNSELATRPSGRTYCVPCSREHNRRYNAKRRGRKI